MTDIKTGIDGKKYVVDPKTAEMEFDRWAESWDIETDPDELTEEDLDSLRVPKGRIVKCIRRGWATVDENDDLEYKLQRHSGALESVKFSLPSTMSLKAMDRHKDGKSMAKLYAVAAHITGQPEKLIAELRGIDSKFMMAVVQLYLGS